MKIKLHKYNRNFPKLFKKEKQALSKIIRGEIHHVGSTAIPNMPGKGWIDILVIAKNHEQRKEIAKQLRAAGYTQAKVRNKNRIFFSKEKNKRRYNLHLVSKDYKKAREMIVFRDYMAKNKDEAGNYWKLKQDNFKKARGDRVKYRKLKRDYFRSITKKIRG